MIPQHREGVAQHSAGSLLRMGRIRDEVAHPNHFADKGMNKAELMTFVSTLIPNLEEMRVEGVTITGRPESREDRGWYFRWLYTR